MMVIQGRWAGRPIVISLKHNSMTLSINEPAEAEVLSYDLEGRPWSIYLDSVAYRRGLDGKVVARWRSENGGGRQRRLLTADEALAVEAHAHRSVCTLYKAIRSDDVQLSTSLPPQAYALLDQAIAFDAARSRADVACYHRIYKPIGILPPDQYMAVVLQATEGCSFNTCTFCSFYKDRPFRIKGPQEFRAHAKAVRAFLAKGLNIRNKIFLADANALVIPTNSLLPLFDIVNEAYNMSTLDGIYAFLDGFSGEKKTSEDYAELGARGLKRVYIGLESGNEALLRFLRKPGKPTDAVNAVHAMKSVGLSVGIIVLLGVGGRQYADAHTEDTVETLNAMKLDGSDILYFSELIVSEGLAYAKNATQAKLTPLSHEECTAQGEAIARGLKFACRDTHPQISRYDIREFIY